MEFSNSNFCADYLYVTLLKAGCDFYRDLDEQTRNATSFVLEEISNSIIDNVQILLEYKEGNIANLVDVLMAWEYFVHRFPCTGGAGFDASIYFDDPDNTSYISTIEESEDEDIDGSSASSEHSNLSDLSPNISPISKTSSHSEDDLSIEQEWDDFIHREGNAISIQDNYDNNFHKIWFSCFTGRRFTCSFTSASLIALESIIEENVIASYQCNQSCSFARAGMPMMFKNESTLKSSDAVLTTPDFDVSLVSTLRYEHQQSQELIGVLQDLTTSMQSSIIYADETTMPTLSSLVEEDTSPAILKKTIALMTQQLLQNELVLHARTKECEELRREVESMKKSLRTIQVETEKYSSAEMLSYGKSSASNVVTVDPMERKRLLRESLLRRPAAQASSSSASGLYEQSTKRIRHSSGEET